MIGGQSMGIWKEVISQTINWGIAQTNLTWPGLVHLGCAKREKKLFSRLLLKFKLKRMVEG